MSAHLKNLFNAQAQDAEKQSGTKSRNIHLTKAQVNKAIQHLNACNLLCILLMYTGSA